MVIIMDKKYCIYICVFSFILLNIFLLIQCFKTKHNQEDYFRLHIVANSNSIDDQIVKLKISKAVTNYINKICNSNYKSSTSAKKNIKNNINYILEIANNELKENNVEYVAYANIGKISYAEKHSNTLDMEEGIYDSVQIILGNGNGENFWSLIFPYAYDPNSAIPEEELKSENSSIEIKFGIIETLKKMVKLTT